MLLVRLGRKAERRAALLPATTERTNQAEYRIRMIMLRPSAQIRPASTTSGVDLGLAMTVQWERVACGLEVTPARVRMNWCLLQ